MTNAELWSINIHERLFNKMRRRPQRCKEYLIPVQPVRYYLAGTPNFPTSCPGLVYMADMHGVYKSKYPLLIKKMSFEVKHFKIETVVLSRSAQAPYLKKTYS